MANSTLLNDENGMSKINFQPFHLIDSYEFQNTQQQFNEERSYDTELFRVHQGLQNITNFKTENANEQQQFLIEENEESQLMENSKEEVKSQEVD